MCNAWNHPPGCTCGWGGKGHAGQSSFAGLGAYDSAYTTRDTRWWVPSLTTAYTSYVNPNASCPVCGAPVFFYQSPNGGRVFFDELGPPWPKHPCTDNSSRPAPRLSVGASQPSTAPPSTKTYTWQREGWQPFVIQSVIGIDKGFLKLTGTLGNESLCFYLQRLVEHHLHDDTLSGRSLAQLKPAAANTYQLSFLLPTGVPVTVRAFVLLADARAEREQQLKAKRAQRAAGKGATRREFREPPPARPGKTPANVIRPAEETALALAYRRVQERQDKV